MKLSDLRSEMICFQDKEKGSDFKIVSPSFSNSKEIDPLNVPKPIIIKLYCKSPEALKGSTGPKCDIWSLGVLIFFALSGEMPFEVLAQL
jgi:calcium-dependent protein kinase